MILVNLKGVYHETGKEYVGREDFVVRLLIQEDVTSLRRLQIKQAKEKQVHSCFKHCDTHVFFASSG